MIPLILDTLGPSSPWPFIPLIPSTLDPLHPWSSWHLIPLILDPLNPWSPWLLTLFCTSTPKNIFIADWLIDCLDVTITQIIDDGPGQLIHEYLTSSPGWNIDVLLRIRRFHIFEGFIVPNHIYGSFCKTNLGVYVQYANILLDSLLVLAFKNQRKNAIFGEKIRYDVEPIIALSKQI